MRPKAARVKTVRALVVLALATSGLVGSALPARAEPVGFKVELLLDGAKEGIARPVDIVWAPGTQRMFFSEEDSGKIWIINGGKLLGRPCVTIGVEGEHDKGLTGLALHPDFNTNKYLYAYYTADTLPPENRVTRFTVQKGRCRQPKTIIAGLGTGIFHQGGQMVFDEDEKLYITTGENNKRELAQDLHSPMGKVLRLNDDGTIPDDNPTFPEEGHDRRIWSYGHRNGFGLAYVPGTDQIVETENGPSCDDELNIIEAGENYGWGPDYKCWESGYVTHGPDPVDPVYRWTDVVAPTDAHWYDGAIESLSGALYVGDFIGSQLHRFDAPLENPAHEVIYNFSTPEQRIIGVTKGPGGWLYLVTWDNIYRLVSGDSEEVAVNDSLSSFQPRKATVEVGGFVRWVRKGSGSPHDIVQRQRLFRMRPTDEAIDFTQTFSSGRFPYECTIHEGMRGTVRVAPTILEGAAGLPFKVKWATNTTDTGSRYDVDYKVNSGRWKKWKRGAETFASVFGRNGNPVSLEEGSRYSFRARSRDGSDKSRWSPVTVERL